MENIMEDKVSSIETPKEVSSPKRIKVLDKDFIPRVLVLRKRKVKARGKEYFQYYIIVPKDLAMELEKEAKPELDEIPLLALVRVAEWYHLLDWSNVKGYLKKSLPRKIKEELQKLGFLPEEERKEIAMAEA